VFDPRHGKQASASSTSSTNTRWSAGARSPAAGQRYRAGKKLLLECKNAGMRIYPTNEAFAQGLKSEEFASA